MVIDMNAAELREYNRALSGQTESSAHRLSREDLGNRLRVIKCYLSKKQGASSHAITVMTEAAKVLTEAHRRCVAHDAVRKAIGWKNQAAA